MTEESSNTELTAGELETIPGYVKNKIKSNKKAGPLARARKEHWPTSLAKVIKKAISISHLITGEDQAESLWVLRDAKHATHRIFDPTTRQLIEVPDHKTRLAAITLELAYTEGRPVERSIAAHADVDDFPALIAKLNASSAFQLLENSSQKTVEGKEIPPALPTPQV